MKKQLMQFAISSSVLLSSTVFAAPFTANVMNDVYASSANGIATANDENDGIPDLHDAVNQILGTSYTANEQLDDRFVEPDSIFTATGQHSVALIGLTAGNTNTLGFYTDTGVGANKTDLLGPISGFGIPHSGTSADPYTAASFNFTGDFGWYLQSNSTTYYSEADLNDGGWDHMMTFTIPELNGQTLWIDTGAGAFEYTFTNAFLIGWEDLPYNQSTGQLGDDDYDDMMYLVDFKPVTEVPVPMTGLMFGTALLGLGFLRRRK